jgi:hypothetical protein
MKGVKMYERKAPNPDATTGEADAWRAGWQAGHAEAIATLLPMVQAARAAQAAAEADLDSKPTGLEGRGA